MTESLVSLFNSYKEPLYKNISLSDYITFVRNGFWQDYVLPLREVLEVDGIEAYKKAKTKNPPPGITGSCIINPNQIRSDKQIKELNGYIVVDIDLDTRIDNELYYALRNDKYTSILHYSLSGNGICIFVKIDPEKFLESYLGLEEYYFKTYNVVTDRSCKDKARFRFVSFDPDIYVNEKANKFIAKNIKKQKPPTKVDDYIFIQDDFDFVVQQITDRRIDLCQDDYFRFMHIGLALASEFGPSGENAFHTICSIGSKYDSKNAPKQYRQFCQNKDGRVSIGTFYHYCKEAGIQIYSDKTKAIINKVKVAKAQGNPTINTIASNLKVTHDIEITDNDAVLIQNLIDSKKDYSKLINQGDSDIEILESFIHEAYEIRRNTLTDQLFVNGEEFSDGFLNEIYITCKKNFDKVPKEDVKSIIYSRQIQKIDPIQDFFEGSQKFESTEIIDDYINCVHPNSDYNRWAFKKWIVGMVHNWTSAYNAKEVSPLTLVLAGVEGGTGKTSFFRNMMPKDLYSYYNDSVRLSSDDKDARLELCTNLLVMDDEFGGKAFKDIKEYKSLSDRNIDRQRRPYTREANNYKRRAGLAGTSNDLEIIKDVTGNRRILPIKVDSVDLDLLKTIDVVDMFYEAKVLLNNGFEWQLYSEEDKAYLKESTSDFDAILNAEELFFNWFRFDAETGFTRRMVFNQSDILDIMLVNTKIQVHPAQIKDVMIKHRQKYQSHRVEGGAVKKGYILFLKDSVDG